MAAIMIELPGKEPVALKELVLDFTGTLSQDGDLLPGVSEKLIKLAKHVRITILTADTFGKAFESLHGLPVEVRIVSTGAEKERYVKEAGQDQVVAIGNGRNDRGMIREAALGIAVVGPDGVAGELLRSADVVVGDIHQALDLLLHPLRLKATLRE
jgi:soluble P-type ATPase